MAELNEGVVLPTGVLWQNLMKELYYRPVFYGRT
jgi:hypothetical protein